MSNVSFTDLLHQAKQLTADVDTGTELPRVERNLPQLAEASHRLLSKTWTDVGHGSDVKASLLLSSKGVELPKLSQQLQLFDTTKTFEPIDSLVETDIHSFLKNERENAILASVEETKRRTFENAEKNFWESLDDNWEREKQKILNSLLSAGKQALSFPADAGRYEGHSIVKSRSTLTNTELSYARQIYICNEMESQNSDFSYLDMLKQVAHKFEDKNAEDIWDVLEKVIHDLPCDQNVRKIRQSNEFHLKLVSNAKQLLQSRYRDYVETCVYTNLQEAQLGGIPGLYNLLLSFLKIKLAMTDMSNFEDGTVNGIPVWPLIFYCLRCGDIDATNLAAEALPPSFSEFKTFLKEFLMSPDHRLSPNNEAKIRLQYKRGIRSSSDAFKRIVFCIVGHCDTLDAHSEVIKKTEDYVWLKLNQIRILDDSNTNGSSLQELQKLLLEDYGESHFKASEQPNLYFNVLFLTGQFEAAIEFLSRIEHYRCHAVHVAIVLQSYGLLLTPDLIHAPLLSTDSLDQPPLKRLNYARLITIYTRKFETTDLREALEYFFLLRHLNGPNGENLFASCVSELALETREFETILGCVNPDGSKKKGCVSKFKLNVDDIVATVAKDAEEKGHLEDAVILYDLADNPEKVLELLNNLVSQLVPFSNSPQSSRERIQTLARSIAERYKSRGHTGSRQKSASFFLLLDLMYYFDLYHEQQYDEALEVMQKIKLIPFTMEEVDVKVTFFRQYSDEVRQCLPDVLLSVMNVLHHKWKSSKNSGLETSFQDAFKTKDENYLNGIRTQARALVTFAGLLPYRMPGDTNARLVQMEIMIN